MERKIGEIFECKGEWYQCVKGDICADCAFAKKHCNENPLFEAIGSCSKFYKKDVTSVIFKKLEKVGEPYVAYGKVRQKYKLYIPLTITNGIIERDIICDDVHGIVDIANKQNKEDMSNTETLWYGPDKKETNRLKLSNLKPFDLEAAKAGKPVCTRDGRKVRIICFDRKDVRPIVALIKSDNGDEGVYYYYADGLNLNNYPSVFDLMMLSEKKEGWVNVYQKDSGFITSKSIFRPKEGAIKFKEEVRDGERYLDTIKIEWKK